MIRKLSKCRICGSKEIHQFLDLGQMPLPNGFLSEEKLEQHESFFPLKVSFCSSCTLVQLAHVVDSELMFRNYSYIPSASHARIENFGQIIKEMISRFPKTKNSLAVDIGSNDGSLLLEFKKEGVKTLGVDPAENLAKVAELRGIHTLPTFFSSTSARGIVKKFGHANYITATNVVAHIDNLHDFFSGIRLLLSPEGLFVCEFPYVVDLLQKNYFDTIYHEHLSYFSVTALVNILGRKKLKIVDIRRTPIDGGALRLTIAKDRSSYVPSTSITELLDLEKSLKLQEMDVYRKFGDRIQELKKEIQKVLYELKKKKKTIAGYGAAARGNILLNYCGIDHNLLDFIVDSTSYKQGLFTPGTHIPIFPESEIDVRKPDYIIILAWNFAQEIMEKQSRYYKAGGRFIVPVPKVEMIIPYREKKKKKVVVVMPAYNAAKTVVAGYKKIPLQYIDDVILVDDGSKDKTYEVAKKLPIKVFRNDVNLGYGGNLKVCLSKALEIGADIIIEYHPDDQYDPSALPKFIEKAQEGYDFALGSRFIFSKEALKNKMPLVKFFANRAMSFIDELVLGLELSEFHSGFRMYTRKLLESVPWRQNSDDYLFSFDIIAQAVFWNFKVAEVPISCRYHPAMHTANLRRSTIYALGTFKRLTEYLIAKFLRYQRGPFLLIQPAPCPHCHKKLTRFEHVVTDAVSGEQFSIFFCTPCQIGFTIPVPEHIGKYYPKSYYSPLKSWVYNRLQFRRRNIITKYRTLGKILDIGCGDGSFGELIPEFSYTGVESGFSAFQRKGVLTTGIEKLRIVPSSFDIVTFWESFEHLKDPYTAITKAKKALKKNGILIVECPNFSSFERFLFGSKWFHLDPPRHLTHFTPQGLAGVLREQGFEIVEQRQLYAPEYIPVGLAQSFLFFFSSKLHLVAQGERSLVHGILVAGLLVLLFPLTIPFSIIFYLVGGSPILLTVARKEGK